jgi:SNF2 family DNA or RNA helicase
LAVPVVGVGMQSEVVNVAPASACPLWSRIANGVVAQCVQARRHGGRRTADLLRVLASDREFVANRNNGEAVSASRVAERMLSIVVGFDTRVRRGVRALAAIDARAVRRGEVQKQQKSFVEESERLTAELTAAVSDESIDVGRLRLLDTDGGRRDLRPYQREALSWLISRYNRNLNGILADEMGLGKTVQTIALLAFFAEHRGDWGPHLVVVPTPVVVNWCQEFRRWAPGFRVIQYIGSQVERKALRSGWTKEGSFNVCVTSFSTLVNDRKVFRSKTWGFLIVDEAHHLKNFASQKYRSLFDMNTQYRLLLTGTPLQTSVMELWSLFHFVLPEAASFADEEMFRETFNDPLAQMAASQKRLDAEVVSRLHSLLRPFMLRRLKSEVAKDLPTKREVVVNCKLSRRQKAMYQGYLNLAETRATLDQGTFQGMVGVLLALRKVCNHPDLFEPRPVWSPFHLTEALDLVVPACCLLAPVSVTFVCHRLCSLHDRFVTAPSASPSRCHDARVPEVACTAWVDFAPTLENFDNAVALKRDTDRRAQRSAVRAWREVVDQLHACPSSAAQLAAQMRRACRVDPISQSVVRCNLAHVNALLRRGFELIDVVRPPVLAVVGPRLVCGRDRDRRGSPRCNVNTDSVLQRDRHFVFPEKRLLVHDCGKLQVLLPLLKRLRSEGHRCVLFTQFTGMLSILEQFLAMYDLTYFRFDGSTKPELRQKLVDRFNDDTRIFALLLSTRAGGVGLNLVGADTVIFYDSDWNPAMDLQAQDRCHRIGQTRPVTIYRLVSAGTVEAAILRKARERKKLNNLVIRGGGFDKLSAAAPGGLGRRDLLQFFTDWDEDAVGNDVLPPDSNEEEEEAAERGAQVSAQDEAWIEATAAVEDAADRTAAQQAAAEQAAADLGADEPDPLARFGGASGSSSTAASFLGGWERSLLVDEHALALRRACQDPVVRWAARCFARTHPSSAAAIARDAKETLAQ